ncbi:hypothetical protein Nepgr_025789 [Nepenthes gracilis]|uniref:60S ribosomal export protein NMD3 n=1 Tax=Nepenthes gracilis TaxID=150966 RepID=A0AAD3T8I6_NEPGR|nr:hypothetical protein Nepgr_025789 [Nepenthes gracilis]
MFEEAGMFVVPQTIGSVLCCKCGIPMSPNAVNMCIKIEANPDQWVSMFQEADMFVVPHIIGSVLCCKCGIPISPNAANMCIKCLCSEVDITDDLQKHFNIVFCPECKRYLHLPKSWIKAQRESKKLSTLIQANPDQWVAMFQEAGMCVVPQTIGSVLCCKCGIPMSPNAANMCIKLRVQKEVLNGATLEQSSNVEYVEQYNMCESCSKIQANPDQWLSMFQEAGMFVVPQTIGSVLCYKCGIPMSPNAANMCIKCSHFEVDITDDLQKHFNIVFCPKCKRYLHPPKSWIKAQRESKELLTLCVMRLKLREVRIQANLDQWVVSVQLQQHVPHRRAFFYLEQLILKHDAAAQAIRTKQMDQGIDFFFSNRSHGVKFVGFVSKVVPVRSRDDKELVSHDPKSNNYNYKYTFSVEICPICGEDLIYLPPKAATSLGNLGVYSGRRLVEFIVLDIDKVFREVNVAGSRYALADAQVTRLSDFGRNDKIFNITTHLGNLLNPGDYAFGYDLYGANTNDSDLDKYKGFVLPDAIVIKKSYEEKRLKKHGKPRAWKLKSLNMEIDSSTRGRLDEDKMNIEYEELLRDLEENPELRFNVSLYNNDYQPSEVASMIDGEDVPSVPLDELLVDLELSDDSVGDDNMS